MSYSRGRVTPDPHQCAYYYTLIYEHGLAIPIDKHTHYRFQMSQITITSHTPKYSQDNSWSLLTQVVSGKLISVICKSHFLIAFVGYVPVKQFCLISSSHFKQILVIDLEMWANCPEITPFHLPKSKAGYVIDTLYSFIWDLTLWHQSSSYVLRKHLVRQYWHFSQGREIGVPWQLECFQDNVTLKTGSYRLYRNSVIIFI